MKAVFFLIQISLAALVGWQGYNIFYPAPTKQSTPNLAVTQPVDGADSLNPNTRKVLGPGSKSRAMETTVVNRNLFKVKVDKDQPGASSTTKYEETEKLPEKTKLKLVLWGTVAGKRQESNWAVIENKKNRSQDLYQTGDNIMGAEIKEIKRNRVILTLDGKDQMLEAETKSSPSRPGPKTTPTAGAITGNNMGTHEQKSATGMFGKLRSRPFMKEGSPAGLLVYGIRPGSPLLAMGLRNGDIIKTINGNEINNSNDLKAIAQEMDSDLEIQINLSRRGQEKEIVYKGVE